MASSPASASAPAHDAAIPDEWRDVLTYLNTLQARPNPHQVGPHPRPEIRDAARRGRRLFFDPEVGCGRCHRGSSFTRSGPHAKVKLYDVGTDKPIDVPALLHLWDRAPYLHDGRARTLRELLTDHNQFDEHGNTSHLDPSQLDDLSAFLLAPYEETDE